VSSLIEGTKYVRREVRHRITKFNYSKIEIVFEREYTGATTSLVIPVEHVNPGLRMLRSTSGEKFVPGQNERTP
jgi:hypothetical protein